jgi:hypothetical protein
MPWPGGGAAALELPGQGYPDKAIPKKIYLQRNKSD